MNNDVMATAERDAVVAFLRMRNGDLTEEEATVLELYAQAIEEGQHLAAPAVRTGTDVLNSALCPANNKPPEDDGPWNDHSF